MVGATQRSRSTIAQTPECQRSQDELRSQSGRSGLSLPTPAVVIKRIVRGRNLAGAGQLPRLSDHRYLESAPSQSQGSPLPLSGKIPDSDLGSTGELPGPILTSKRKRRLPWESDSETESGPRRGSRLRGGDATETSSLNATPVPEARPQQRDKTKTPSIRATPRPDTQPQPRDRIETPSIRATQKDAQPQPVIKIPPVHRVPHSQSSSRSGTDMASCSDRATPRETSPSRPGEGTQTESILSTPHVAWSQPRDNTSERMPPPPRRTLGEPSRGLRASSQVSSAFGDGQSASEAGLDLTAAANHRARLAAQRARRDPEREQQLLESERSSLPNDDRVVGIPGLDLEHLGRMSRHGRPHQTDRQASEMARLERMMTEIQPRHGRVVRVRIGWSKKETRRLIKLWQLYGNCWSQIKGADEEIEPPRLTHRTQLDLKDKMRNVKAFMAR